ncbi:MAG: outer membrane lipoprotein carrier protein LolA [Planctomycetota bacterium]
MRDRTRRSFMRLTTTLFLRGICALILLCAAGAAVADDDGGLSEQEDEVLKKLKEEMTDISTVAASFTQEKQFGVMDRTMRIQGHMAIEKPGQLAWHVDEPVRYRVVIREAELRQWDEDTDQVNTLDLEDNPGPGAMFQQLTLWLSGDYEPLLDTYSMDVLDTDPIKLKFIPREDSMFDDMLKHVIMSFSEDAKYLETLTIHEENDSISTITFQDAVLNEEIEDDKWEVKP